mmetsp:Transcript_18178/g.28525  ORF Transcript_18178/g.28525 Transcript_18178/m.28525 type:complete len:208 (-) Transcript_18178:47-670(-)
MFHSRHRIEGHKRESTIHSHRYVLPWQPPDHPAWRRIYVASISYDWHPVTSHQTQWTIEHNPPRVDPPQPPKHSSPPKIASYHPKAESTTTEDEVSPPHHIPTVPKIHQSLLLHSHPSFQSGWLPPRPVRTVGRYYRRGWVWRSDRCRRGGWPGRGCGSRWRLRGGSVGCICGRLWWWAFWRSLCLGVVGLLFKVFECFSGHQCCYL